MSYQEQTTLMTVANRLAIGDLTARYNRALETGDLEAWIGTFVQEGVVRGPGESFSGHRELTGSSGPPRPTASGSPPTPRWRSTVSTRARSAAS